MINAAYESDNEALRRFGKRLCDLRKKEGMSQQQLADRIGVTQVTICNWEGNATTKKAPTYPKIEYVLALCRIFECEIDYLFAAIPATTHDNAFLCEETGLSEKAVDRLRTKKETIIRALDFILPHRNGEDVFSELLSFIDMEYRPYIEISASQGQDVTFLSDVDHLSLNGRSVDRDILRQAIIVNLQWLLTGISHDAEKEDLLTKGNGVQEQPFFYTTRNLSKLEAPNASIQE